MRTPLTAGLAAGAALLCSIGAVSAAHADPLEDNSGNVAQQYGAQILEGEGLTTQGFGSVALKEQTGLINQNGAPLVNVDLSCPAPWVGGVIHGTLGNNYAACNTDDISQVKTGSLIG
ncbi:hypothetical protein ACFTWH_06500 [Streptomyces sp. NPDC057011]|uniref:hypothetical protein n=1 Tax=unclassified Streptomyces TaxID=2593676 RepID=UPI00363B258A